VCSAREVDGQGLTERVRLTPMGRELVAGWPGEIPRAALAERIHQNLRRHRPRPMSGRQLGIPTP